MKFFEDWSIKNKLIGIILLINILSLGTGFLIVIRNDIQSFRKEMIDSTTVIAKVIGDYSVVDLAFRDRQESEKTLARLNSIRDVDSAYLYDSSGVLFSSYNRSGDHYHPPPAPEEDFSRFEKSVLHVVHTISEHGREYGKIYLHVNTRSLDAKIRDYLLTMLGLMLVLIILSVFLALRLQEFISRPILALAETSGKLSEREDYSHRVPKGGKDEIGVLYDAFNKMLEAIENRQQERDRAEEALRQSEKRFRDLVQQSNDALYVLQGNQFVFINPKFQEYFGYTQEETSSPDFDFINLVAPQDRQFILERGEKQKKGESIPAQFTFRGISRNGKTYVLEANTTAILWEGEPAILGTLRDVTERTLAEEKLRRQQEQLKQYAEELERSNRELDQFAYVTSHDLKAPLQAISNLSEWIEEDLADKVSGESRRHLDLLRKRVQRMVALIEGILEYSRVRRIRQKPELVDTGQLVHEVIEMLERPLEMTIQIQNPMPVIETERVRLQQVFSNLIGNAIKHHDRKDGKVFVSWQDLGDFYKFSVSDDGPGIARQYHEKIFLIFQTLKPRDKFESTGVGLALVKRIVEDQGGIITLESAEGKGATFHFTWPKKPKPIGLAMGKEEKPL